MRRRRSRATLAVVFAACWAFVGASIRAQTPKPTEYEVEAAYLSNFGRFITWPVAARSADTFNVCVLGQDPFGPLLDAALRGESIGASPMAPRRITTTAEALGCRIVYINSAKDNQLKAILAGLRNSSVLTVSDAPDFTRQGGMIQFILDANRVRFEINLAAAQRAGLTLSSDLLKVAVTIRRAP